MKDAKGHGSDPRSAQETDKRLKLGASKGGLTLGERYQATMDKRNKTGIYADNEQAASALASGPKSAPAPVHDAMTSRRVNEALGSMSRLRETFRAGDNRHGEYGRNVREAFERHAKVYAELTGKKPPHIYD